ASLSILAFDSTLPGLVGIVLTVSLVLFAFTTILSWSYIGERCWTYLFGVKVILPFRLLWVVAVYFGALAELDFVWLLADTLNGFMAIPNLIALLLLSPVVIRLTRAHFVKHR